MIATTTPRGTGLVPLTDPHVVEIRRVAMGASLTIATSLPPVEGWTFAPSGTTQARPSPVPGMIAASLERARVDLEAVRRRCLACDLAPLERDVGRMIEAAELTLPYP